MHSAVYVTHTKVHHKYPNLSETSDVLSELSELLSIISGNGYDEIILCGDFNLDILSYDNNENTLNLLILSRLNHSFR